jgi:hypothetical protein
MQKSGIGAVAPGEVPSGSSLLRAVGGIRGILESIIPGLAFLVVYTTTHLLLPSVLVPLAIAVVFIVLRLVQRSGISQALVGLVLLAISAVFALVSGKPEANFLPGIWINTIFLLVIIASILARWPLIGIIVGFLTSEPTEWRASRPKRRVLFVATWLWAGLFVIRLAIELPLYFTHETGWLAGARLITGVPLYATFLWLTWLLVRTVYSRSTPAGSAPAETPAE